MAEKIYYVTKEKLAELQKEYESLVAFERQKVVGQEAPKMLESEEMSAEFVSYQEDMDALRARLDELEHVMNHHEIIKKPAKDQQKIVAVGATVALETNGKKNEFTLVGTLEANPMEGRISNESPVGKAILGKAVGEEVMIETPEKLKYKIKDIKYQIG